MDAWKNAEAIKRLTATVDRVEAYLQTLDKRCSDLHDRLQTFEKGWWKAKKEKEAVKPKDKEST
jgi:hypothetical protein